MRPSRVRWSEAAHPNLSRGEQITKYHALTAARAELAPKHRHPHALRHAFATRMNRDGAPTRCASRVSATRGGVIARASRMTFAG
jgi:site-specific recombinase XerD